MAKRAPSASCQSRRGRRPSGVERRGLWACQSFVEGAGSPGSLRGDGVGDGRRTRAITNRHWFCPELSLHDIYPTTTDVKCQEHLVVAGMGIEPILTGL